MSVKLEQMFVNGSILNELRNEIKRISSSFQECGQENIRRQRARNQGGRYTAWDYPEALFHDLKSKMK
jgi:hypothetical protein